MQVSGEFHKAIMGGFDRKEVLAYIAKLDEQAKIAQDKTNEELKEVSAKYLRLKRQKEEFLIQVRELEEKTEELNNRISEITNENKTLLEEINTKEKIITETNKKLDETKALADINSKAVQSSKNELVNIQELLSQKESEITELKSKLKTTDAMDKDAAEDIDKLRDKSEKYDAFTNQLGKVFLDAHKRADMIIDNALMEAEKLAKDANASAGMAYKEFSLIKDNVSELKNAVDSSLSQINTKLNYLSVELEMTLKRLDIGFSNEYESNNKQEDIENFVEKIALENKDKIANNACLDTKKQNKTFFIDRLFRLGGTDTSE